MADEKKQSQEISFMEDVTHLSIIHGGQCGTDAELKKGILTIHIGRGEVSPYVMNGRISLFSFGIWDLSHPHLIHSIESM